MNKSIIDNIKSAQLQARKDRDEVKSVLLTTLIGEASMKGKNDGNRESNDADFLSVLKKFITNIDDTLAIFAKNPAVGEDKLAERKVKEDKLQQEKAILVTFLPVLENQMTDEEIRSEIKNIINKFSLSSPKGMGTVMKELKSHFDGKYDTALASKLAKELLV